MFVGRITKDAEIKKLNDDREVVNFSIAVNDYYKSKGAELGVTTTTYYNCSYWISSKIAPRLTKGSLVEITGRVKVNAYMGLDGEAKASVNCHVNTITIHQQVKSDATHQEKKEEVVEDLPF